MSNIIKRLASDIGVQPAYVVGNEGRGLSFFTWHDSIAIGAQCSNCNIILWLDPRFDGVLSEQKPAEVPSSGEEYRTYFKDKTNRFLKNLPQCPSCGHKSYNKFINNTSHPRYIDGKEFDDKNGEVSLKNEDPCKVLVWWLDQ